MSEKWDTIGSATASKELLKFIYQCIDTNSDDKIWILDFKRKCSKYPEVATFVGQGFDELVKGGKTTLSYEDLYRLFLQGGFKKTEISLQTRRKLMYDFLSDKFLFVTPFNIAQVCIQHPIFLKFLVHPENTGNLGRISDYFNKVYLAGRTAYSSKQKSFDDFCYFLDQDSAWNAKSGQVGSMNYANNDTQPQLALTPRMLGGPPSAFLTSPRTPGLERFTLGTFRKEAYSQSPVRARDETKLRYSRTLSPVSVRNRPSEILPDMTILNVSGDLVLGRDGLPVTKNEVILCRSGNFLLCSDGHLVLVDELQLGHDGRLLGPDQLPVRDMWQPGKILKADDLLHGSEGIPVISKGSTLNRKTEVMHVGYVSMSLDEVRIRSDGTFIDEYGKEILGDDGFALVKGEVLMRHDGKPFLTFDGRPILQHDLKFSHTGTLCGPGGFIIRDSFGQPLLREHVYSGSDGRPRLDRDGKVVEMKDVVHNFTGTPLFAVAFKEPITRKNLKFSRRGELMGLGTVIRKKDTTPYMRGEVMIGTDGKPLLSKKGHPITVANTTFSRALASPRF